MRPGPVRWGPRAAARLMLVVLSFLAMVASTDAMPYEVAVLYPDVDVKYRQIFEHILEGLGQSSATRTTPILVNEATDPASVERQLREQQARAVITLGVRGYQVAKEIKTRAPVIIGALVVAPNGITGVSLAGDPREFLTQLNQLAPQVERVFVVYSEGNSGWLVRKAEVEARQRNLQLIAYRAVDVREAIRHYQRVLDEARDGTDAIWLPLDSIVPDETVLPMVLESAWKRHLVVFSNNPSHVKKGALFALYPDHRVMGRLLAELVVERLRPDSRPHVIPTRDQKLAVNQRTASHLGLSFTAGQRRQFDLVYPSD